MLRIEFQEVSKVFPPARRGGQAVHAVEQVTCAIEPGELFFLLGPSGCGKTTLLRMLAGFVTPTGGKVVLDGRDATHLPPEKRRLAMVFQSYALWPHMTVTRNVEFGPRTARWPAARRKEAVNRMLALVGMEDRRDYKPPQLSGGQQQRVALARALAVEPRGLLFDEPLSNLDARLRERMRGEIRRIVKDAGATAVYVTHDQEEALSMADRIAVMDAGRIIQTGTPREVYRRPANRFVADFLGEANFLSARVSGKDGNLVVLETAGGTLRARAAGEVSAGATVTCCFRPEALRLGQAEGPSAGTLAARCVDSTYFGQTTRYNLALGSGELVRVLTLGPGPAVEAGKALTVSLAPDDVVVLAG